uniref:Uncharacterized protein n=1 Tax=Aegilops tauschii subsp. strangulata TaxID=200361 RepID=A0A453SLF1_AEGTS
NRELFPTVVFHVDWAVIPAGITLTKQALAQLVSPIYFLEVDRGGQPRSKSSVAT